MNNKGLHLTFLVSLYIVVAIPFLMLVTGGGVGALSGGVFAIVLVVSWFVGGGRLADPKFANLWNLVILLFVGGSLIQLFTTDEQILDLGIRLLMVLTLLKLLSRAGARDELQLFLLSFMMLAASTTVSEELIFGILFVVYVLVGTFSLAVFHLKDELDLHPRIRLGSEELINSKYVGVLSGISIVILVMSIGIFFVFPRIGLGFFVQQSRDLSPMTGFSESVELGGHGVLRTNPEVVMRVQFPDSKPREDSFHWRMTAFDHYDGMRWSRTIQTREKPLYKSATKNDIIVGWPDNGKYDTTQAWPAVEPYERIEVYLEPMETNLLPTLWPTGAMALGSSEVKLPFGPGSGSLTMDGYAAVRHTIKNRMGVPYTLWVGKPEPTPAKDVPTAEYLQHPESARITALSESIVQNMNSNTEKANALEAYLDSNFSYTTDLPDTGDNPVEGFLFDAKRGHCEYFATSMVLMLRSVGVPARLVNGFLGGKWNDVGGYLAVRQGDAHSWVEYWDPDLGWVEIDPTPSNEVLPASVAMARMRQYWDAARLVWMKWVIEYDLGAQIELAQSAAQLFRPDGLLKASPEAPKERGEEFKPNTRVMSMGALFLLFILGFWRTRVRLPLFSTQRLAATIAGWAGLGALVVMLLKGWTWSFGLLGAGSVLSGALMALLLRPKNTPTLRAIQAFDIVARAASRRGYTRGVDEGPASFLDRLITEFPAARAQIRAFKRRYLHARFGEGPVDDTLEQAATSVAKTLKNTVQSKPTPSETL